MVSALSILPAIFDVDFFDSFSFSIKSIFHFTNVIPVRQKEVCIISEPQSWLAKIISMSNNLPFHLFRSHFAITRRIQLTHDFMEIIKGPPQLQWWAQNSNLIPLFLSATYVAHSQLRYKIPYLFRNRMTAIQPFAHK